MSNLSVRGSSVRNVVRGTESYLLASHREKLPSDQRDAETFRTNLNHRLLPITAGLFRRVGYTLYSRCTAGQKGSHHALWPSVHVSDLPRTYDACIARRAAIFEPEATWASL